MVVIHSYVFRKVYLTKHLQIVYTLQITMSIIVVIYSYVFRKVYLTKHLQIEVYTLQITMFIIVVIHCYVFRVRSEVKVNRSDSKTKSSKS